MMSPSARSSRQRLSLSLRVGGLVCLLAATGDAIAAGSRSASGKPNVVFIIANDLNDWVGWLGGHAQSMTPNMDRLARLGVRFANAHCSQARSNASRTSLLTGMLPSSSGVYDDEQDWRVSVEIAGKPTLPEFLKANGYATFAAGKVFHASHGGPDARLTGWQGGRRGFELDATWTDRFPQKGIQVPDQPVRAGRNMNGLDRWSLDWGPIDFSDEQMDDGMVADWAAGVLGKKHSKPFFLAVGLYRPGGPWYVPRRYFDELPPVESIQLPPMKENDLDDVPAFARTGAGDLGEIHSQIVAKGAWRDSVRAYLASVRFCDAMVGRVLDALEKGPNAKNTIVCFASDRGAPLGAKQHWEDGSLWEMATHVPLTLHVPGSTSPDSVSTQPVSLLDLYPTLCELLRLKAPAHLDGESLVPLLKDPTATRNRPALTLAGDADHPSAAVRTMRWRYIRHADGSEELYDHDKDPHEWTNLAGLPEHADLKNQLAAAFPSRWWRSHRPATDLVLATGADDSVDVQLQAGDVLSAAEAPRLQGRGVYMDGALDYQPEHDSDATVLYHGDSQLGYALHVVAGRPTLSVFVNGKSASVAVERAEAGRLLLRAMISPEGELSIGVPGKSEIYGESPLTSGFPAEPAVGIKVGQSFGVLSKNDYPNSSPLNGRLLRLRLTVLPKPDGQAQPEAAKPPATAPPSEPSNAPQPQR